MGDILFSGGGTPQGGTQTVIGSDTVGATVALNGQNVSTPSAAGLALAGQSSVGFQLAAGTLASDLIPEVSFDGGTTWVTAEFYQLFAVNSISTVQTVTNPNSALSLGVLLPGGASHVRVRTNNYISGTANGTLRAVTQAQHANVAGALASAGSPTYTSGRFGPISMTTGGFLRTAIADTFGGTIAATAAQALKVALADTITSSISLAALNNTISVAMAGLNSASLFISSAGSNLVATLVAEGSPDGGFSWPVSLYFIDPVSGAFATSVAVSSPQNTYNGIVVPNGLTHVRVRVSAYTSGSSNATLVATAMVQQGNLTSGSVTTAAPTYTTGQRSPLSLTTTGALRVDASGASGDTKVNVDQWGGAGTTLGQKVAASSVPVVIATDQTAVASNITQVGNATLALGQQSMANSVPVVLASNQTDVPVNIDKYGGTLTTLGQKASASSQPVVIASDQSAVPVSGTVTANQGGAPWQENITQFGGNAVVTGTGASGVGIPRVTVANDSTITANQGTANATPWNTNVAQWGGSATTLGQKASAASVPVVLASDQATFPVTVTFPATQPVSVASGADADLMTLVASNRVLNQLMAQQVFLATNPPGGFIPIETPTFLTGL